MLNARPAFVLSLVAALWMAAISLSLAGCGSERAGATSDRTARAAPLMPSGGLTSDITAATKRTPPAPGAKTVALAPVGDRPYDKSFDDIRFDIQPGQPFHRQMLPDAIEALVDQRIRIRGYILPTAQKRGIKQFVLVRDNQECCFGPGAALYDCILVEMQGGNTAEFSIRPVAVEGTFGIQEIMGPDDKHLAIYHLAGESVQ